MSPYPPGTDPLLAATIDAAIAAGHITTEDPPTEAEWAAAKGAHQRQLAAVQTNPISKAAFDPTTARDRASLRGVIVVVGRHDSVMTTELLDTAITTVKAATRASRAASSPRTSRRRSPRPATRLGARPVREDPHRPLRAPRRAVAFTIRAETRPRRSIRSGSASATSSCGSS